MEKRIITLDDCLQRVPEENKYSLVLLAAERTRALGYGAKPFISNTNDQKLFLVSLQEIVEGYINRDNIGKNSVVQNIDDSLSPTEVTNKTFLDNEFGLAYQDEGQSNEEITEEDSE